jgi:hypothetical protein
MVNATTTATPTSDLVKTIIDQLLALAKSLNELITSILVPILAPYFGEAAARILIYVILILGSLWAANRIFEGWIKYVLIFAAIFLAAAFLVT